MDAAARLGSTHRGPQTNAQLRAHALQVVEQFESVFARSLVAGMRETANLGGEDGGLFGSGPGADTYADWFDQHLADALGQGRGLGIRDVLMRDLERWKQIPPAPPKTAPHTQPREPRHGGIDVAA